MRVLIIGGGCREHALAWKLRGSPLLTELFAAPGNPGIAQLGTVLTQRIPDPKIANWRDKKLYIRDVVRLVKFYQIDLVVIGPDAPLAYGLADALMNKAIGPWEDAAKIEWSKTFGRHVADAGKKPNWGSFSTLKKAEAFALKQSCELVIKEDGLAFGKGVFVTSSTEEALEQLRKMAKEGYFTAGRRVVIEPRLYGREVSAHAFTDGETVLHMPMSCDYKRLLDGDGGPNTGGMGAYAPVPWLRPEIEAQIQTEITEPAVRNAEKLQNSTDPVPYDGIIYPGVMVAEDGPKVLEFNARFGDPEAQVILPLLKTDLLEIFEALRKGRLGEIKIEWEQDKFAVAVVLASEGRSEREDVPVNRPITGLNSLDEDVRIFHGATKRGEEGRLVTAGGRVLPLVEDPHILVKAV